MNFLIFRGNMRIPKNWMYKLKVSNSRNPNQGIRIYSKQRSGWWNQDRFMET